MTSGQYGSRCVPCRQWREKLARGTCTRCHRQELPLRKGRCSSGHPYRLLDDSQLIPLLLVRAGMAPEE